MIKVEENKLIVPRGIRYISDWTDYSLEQFQFPHILDKKIPGCGYTEYCLTNNLPIILCSPRKILLENKEEQHPNTVFYFKNELDKDLGMDKDITNLSKTAIPSNETDSEDSDSISEIYKDLLNKLSEYINYCCYNNLVPKILVTYDSFRLVKGYLKSCELLNNFYIVVDEMQSIFCDSRFKSTTEMEFINQLHGLNRVCFVSATPMIDKYLKQINEFKDLPYYEIDWATDDPCRVIKPELKVRTTQSVVGTAVKIIETYKQGDYESSLSGSGSELIYSTEAVFYVNSVNNIISIIKKAELNFNECNILCANTDYNEKRIKTKLGRKWSIGRVPLRGEAHKMFTFCTRTVYLGADFYSRCSRSFILSDANIDSLAVDISLDLPQILGRQRLLENPWKNRAEFYYKTLGKANELTEEEFNRRVEEKIKRTKDLLNSYSDTRTEAKHTLAVEYQKLAKSFNYRDHYVAVNEHGGADLLPCMNNLVMIAEQRAFEIQQVDYKDRFTVFNTMDGSSAFNTDMTADINSFIKGFNTLGDFPSRMKAICECPLSDAERAVVLDQLPIQFRNYYLALGPERCKALSYNHTLISREYSDNVFIDPNQIDEEISNSFQVGEKYPMSEIKQALGNIYKKFDYNKSPMATDLEAYFEIKRDKITIDGKRVDAFKILNKK